MRIIRGLPRRQARPGDIWHLDEVQVAIAGKTFWLWRAVDQLVELMKRYGFVPRRIMPDKPASNAWPDARSRHAWSIALTRVRTEGPNTDTCSPENEDERYRTFDSLADCSVSCRRLSSIGNRFSVPSNRRSASARHTIVSRPSMQEGRSRVVSMSRNCGPPLNEEFANLTAPLVLP